jgi:hypothetical protein
MTVLHTWDSKLGFFPHVHVMLLGGFLDGSGHFVRIQRKVVFPHNALSKRFKTVFLKSLREALREKIPSSFWKLAWVVYSKKNFASHYNVVEYLGRYIKRIGIGASRIVKVDKGGVVFEYRHRLSREKSEYRKMSISGEAFLQRYLQHILPKGFVRLRYYGLLHPYWAEALEKIKLELGEEVEENAMEETETQCPDCELPLVTVLVVLPSFGPNKKWGRKFYINKASEEIEDEEMKKPAYNKLIERTARGRHAPCGPAVSSIRLKQGSRRYPPGLSVPGQALRPCSPLISALYARN